MSDHGHLTGRLSPQTLLQGRYLIVGPAGRGGMGAVYEAVDTKRQPDRRVAIKEMSQARLTTNEEIEKARKRFRGEASMHRSLDHRNLPRVYGSFVEGNRSYLVMEFIEGQTLLQLLEAMPGGRALPVADVMRYAIQLCTVLDYLHRQYPPIIFRDLKPANVMVKPNGEVVLIDFGIARFFKAGQSQDTEAFGSLAYASPQQLSGEQTNVRSDLYSLGATLHHCLTGKVPNYTQNRHVYPPVSDFNLQVTSKFERIIMSLVEFREDHRPKSAEAVRLELQNAFKESTEYTLASFSGQRPVRVWNGFWFSPNAPTSPIDDPTPPSWMTDPGNANTSFAAWWSITVFPALLRFLMNIQTAARGLFSPKSTPRKPVTFADVKIGFSRVGRDIVSGGEDVWFRVRNWSSRVLTPAFMGLLLLRLLLLIGASIYMFHAFNGSNAIVAFCLALILLLVTSAASTGARVRDPVARSIFFCTALTVLIACVALQAYPDVQNVLRTITLSQVLTAMLVMGAFTTLVRTVNRLAWVDYVTLVLVAGTIALMQYTLGPLELLKMPMLTYDHYQPILLSLTATALLAFIAFYFLCRLASIFSRFDRFLLLVVALLFASLQLFLGYDELPHLHWLTSILASGGKLNFADVDVLLILVPLLGAGAAVIFGHRFAYISRVAIFLLALACAFLQNASIADINISFSSTATISPLTLYAVNIFSFNQLIIYGGFLVAVLLLFVRLIHQQSWIDRPAVFVIAIVSALLLLSLAPQLSHFSLFGVDPSLVNPDLLIALSQIIASGLLICVAISICITVLSALVNLARQVPRVNRGAQAVVYHFIWVPETRSMIDRIIILGVVLTATLLIAFFGDTRPVLAQSYNVQGSIVSVIPVSLVLLAFLTVVALFRIKGQFNRWDCFTVLIAALACALLAFQNENLPQITPLQLTNIQQFMGNLLQGNVPNILLFFALLASAALSLLWLRRTPTRVDHALRFVLIISFAGAIFFLLLQHLWQPALLVALVMLIEGVFVAMQMERVR